MEQDETPGGGDGGGPRVGEAEAFILMSHSEGGRRLRNAWYGMVRFLRKAGLQPQCLTPPPNPMTNTNSSEDGHGGA